MFKVGQKVWCVACGEGTVTAVKEPGSFTYPMSVRFINGEKESYTADGKLFEHGKRVLFFSEPEIKAAETPPFEPTLVAGKEYMFHCDFKVDFKPSIFISKVHLETEDDVWIDENAAISKTDIVCVREVLDVIKFKKD